MELHDITTNRQDFATLCICALRYCQGRQSYMPDLVRSIIRPHLKELDENDLAVLIHDCNFQEQFELYGDEHIDKPGWLKWKQELEQERDRRHETC